MQVLNIFHVLIAIALVVFVLIQKGQGATAGAAFGSGASGTVFGARGAGASLDSCSMCIPWWFGYPLPAGLLSRAGLTVVTRRVE